MRPARPALLALLVTTALAATAARAEAQGGPYTWNGSVDADWHTTENWSPTGSAWGEMSHVTDMNQVAILGPSAVGSVDLNSSAYAYRVQFDGDGWTLAGLGSLGVGTGGITVSNGTTSISTTVNLHANQTWDIGSSSTLSLSGTLGEDAPSRSLTKTGAGTLILSGSANRTGGTTISAGTLQLGNGGGSGSIGTGNITNNGTLVLNRSGVYQLSNAISGSGQLIHQGSGTVTVSGANTYTGTTTVSNGILHFANRGSLYDGNPTNWTAANITVAEGATLALSLDGADPFSAAEAASIGSLASGSTGFQAGAFLGLSGNGDEFTYSNAIADTSNGSLGLVKLGGNTIILTGTNTYTGTTKVLGGVLQIGNGTTTGSIAGNIQNDNTLIFNPAPGSPLTYSGTITGSVGLIEKAGTGTLTLMGNVSAASLNVDAGTLRGTATINAPFTVASGATVRPGTGAGSDNLTLESGGTLTGGSTLAIDVAETTNSQLVITGGTLDLSELSPTNRLNIHLAAVGELTSNQLRVITIVDATGGTIEHGSGFNAAHLNVTADFPVEDGLFTLTDLGTSLTISFTPVPEPATVLGVAVGALAVGGFVRRRWRKPAGGATIAP